MTIDERLAVRRARAHVRVVEDLNFALEESEPSKAGIEEALQDQIGHGKQLLEMAEAACYLASVERLRSETRERMHWALTVGVKAFRDLRQMVANWTRQHNGSLAGAPELDPLIAQMEQCRAELTSNVQERQRDTAAGDAAFPQVGPAEWSAVNQRRAELIRKKLRGELSASERGEYETLQRSRRSRLPLAFLFLFLPIRHHSLLARLQLGKHIPHAIGTNEAPLVSDRSISPEAELPLSLCQFPVPEYQSLIVFDSFLDVLLANISVVASLSLPDLEKRITQLANPKL